MNTHIRLGAAALAAAVLLQGCAITSHPVVPASLGAASGSAEMERLLDQPGPIELSTINSADWAVPLSGLVNLKSAAARSAGLAERDEPIQVYAHVLRHPRHGVYLVDTGVSGTLLADPGKEGVNWLIRKAMPIEQMKLRQGTAAILDELKEPVAGVFLTHLHLDHIIGLPDIPAGTPLYVGPAEARGKHLINMFLQGATDQLLRKAPPLREWRFDADPQQRFDGVLDIFGDGSAFAISVPGHTPGSIAYLVRSTKGTVLLTGDTSHTRWGWEHAVEPGDYTVDQAANLASLRRLKALAARHPGIDVRFGHQR